MDVTVNADLDGEAVGPGSPTSSPMRRACRAGRLGDLVAPPTAAQHRGWRVELVEGIAARVRIASNARLAWPVSRSRRWAATPDWTLIVAIAWATESCRSRAMRSRSLASACSWARGASLALGSPALAAGGDRLAGEHGGRGPPDEDQQLTECRRRRTPGGRRRCRRSRRRRSSRLGAVRCTRGRAGPAVPAAAPDHRRSRVDVHRRRDRHHADDGDRQRRQNTSDSAPMTPHVSQRIHRTIVGVDGNVNRPENDDGQDRHDQHDVDETWSATRRLDVLVIESMVRTATARPSVPLLEIPAPRRVSITSRVSGRSSYSSKRRSRRTCRPSWRLAPTTTLRCVGPDGRARRSSSRSPAGSGRELVPRSRGTTPSGPAPGPRRPGELEEDHRQLLVGIGFAGIVPIDDARPTVRAAEVVGKQVALTDLHCPRRRKPASRATNSSRQRAKRSASGDRRIRSLSIKSSHASAPTGSEYHRAAGRP